MHRKRPKVARLMVVSSVLCYWLSVSISGVRAFNAAEWNIPVPFYRRCTYSQKFVKPDFDPRSAKKVHSYDHPPIRLPGERQHHQVGCQTTRTKRRLQYAALLDDILISNILLIELLCSSPLTPALQKDDLANHLGFFLPSQKPQSWVFRVTLDTSAPPPVPSVPTTVRNNSESPYDPMDIRSDL